MQFRAQRIWSFVPCVAMVYRVPQISLNMRLIILQAPESIRICDLDFGLQLSAGCGGSAQKRPDIVATAAKA